MTDNLKQRPPMLADMAQAVRAQLVVTATERRNLVISVAIFIAAALVPLIFGGYALQLAISIVMYTALATSWLLFSGPTNYIALSTAAFFGIGMYVVAGGIDLLPYPVLIAAAALAGGALAAVVGLATLRVSGVYFVIFSLGLAELVRQIMTWLQHVLGTMSGIYVTIDRSEPEYYWQLLLLTAVVYLVGWWIGRSRLGFALRIIGNDEIVAVHCGINTARAKVVLFVISSTFAAIVGALVAPRWSYVEPVVAFSPFVSFQVVIMALLGGTHRLWGPLLGVIPFVVLWEVISLTFPNQTTLLLGVCFLLIVYVIPNGITGLVEDALTGHVDLRRMFDDARDRARKIVAAGPSGLYDPLRDALDRGLALAAARGSALAGQARAGLDRGIETAAARGGRLGSQLGGAFDRGVATATARGNILGSQLRKALNRGVAIAAAHGVGLGGALRDALNRAIDSAAGLVRSLVQRWKSYNA